MMTEIQPSSLGIDGLTEKLLEATVPESRPGIAPSQTGWRVGPSTLVL